MRFVGIDEAGYGPNLGPLVMTAVIAEGPEESQPDLWNDLSRNVSRASSKDGRLWIDDSKAVYRGGKGLDRLEAATLTAIAASGKTVPTTISTLLECLGIASIAEAELDPWLVDDRAVPIELATDRLDAWLKAEPFSGADWRIESIRSVIVGPGRFNRDLAALGLKSSVHFAAFERLIRPLWDDSGHVFARGDKHGGRHYYAGPLSIAFPDARIDRIEEGPGRSVYALHGMDRRLDLELIPRADSVDGLVALASMVSKLVRERWMGIFNAFWASIIPDLKPTAGYPVDAARFRIAIEPACERRGLDPALWWRNR